MTKSTGRASRWRGWRSGNLYHLNAEQEPECPDYPKDPEFKKRFGPRGVLHTWANPDGTQKIEDTGTARVLFQNLW